MAQVARPDNLDRYLPAAGILSVALFAVAAVFESSGPGTSDSVAGVAAKFANDQAGVFAASYLLIAGNGFFVVFLAGLRSALRRAERESGTVSAMAFGA